MRKSNALNLHFLKAVINYLIITRRCVRLESTGALTLIIEMKSRNLIYNAEVIKTVKNKLKSIK